jgi:hypothetical protein
VYARMVSTTGIVGPETQISADGSWWQASVDVAYSTVSKEFFVVWQAAGIRGQRVSNINGLLGTNIFVTGTSYHRDPSVAYNPVANEFMVVYAGDDGSAFVGARRVAAGSGALVGSQTLLSHRGGLQFKDKYIPGGLVSGWDVRSNTRRSRHRDHWRVAAGDPVFGL